MSGLPDVSQRLAGGLRRAFSQFLMLPLTIVTGFVGLTALVYWADESWSGGDVPHGFAWLGKMLGDSGALATLLATIASSIITVTSITFSLLLIAVQQGSSSLTTQVTDQFLMRRSNQIYFGYFVGLAIFVLLSLVTASSIHRPVFGASLIVVLTIVALCMMVVLIYSTIDQMRPTQIVHAIHHHVLRARDKEVRLLAATRRRPRPGWHVLRTVRSPETGHVVAIDVRGLQEEVGRAGGGRVEVQFTTPVGRFSAFGDPLATLRAAPGDVPGPEVLERVRRAVLGAVRFDDARNLRDDPSFGINQLATIAWTSISTAKSNPAPGLAVVQSLRDVLARWSGDGGEVPGTEDALVVVEDAAPREAIDCLEHVVLATSESLQAQTLAHALRTLAILLGSAPPPWRERLAEVARRVPSSLGEHVLTIDLEDALAALSSALSAHGFGEVGEAVRGSTATLATTLGRLNSRSTRVPGAA